MKIGIIVPNIGLSHDLLEERRHFLQEFASPGTTVEVIKNNEGPVSIESEYEHEEGSVQIVRTIMRLRDEGFDAFIPWCGGDPGVVAGRERSDVPVIGPFQSSCAMATLLGFSFSILTPRTNPRLVENHLRAMGLKDRLASIRQLDLPVLGVRADLEKTTEVLAVECRKAVAEDRADAIVFGCMALFGVAERLRGSVNVPVIDPALAALSTAQSVVKMGLTHSPLAYPFPKSGNR